MSTDVIEVVKALQSENLFSRPQARRLESLISEAFARSNSISLDFDGARMLTPSFFDEMLWVIEGQHTRRRKFKVYLVNAPEPLDSKFSAVATGHELALDRGGGARWILSAREAIGHRDS